MARSLGAGRAGRAGAEAGAPCPTASLALPDLAMVLLHHPAPQYPSPPNAAAIIITLFWRRRSDGSLQSGVNGKVKGRSSPWAAREFPKALLVFLARNAEPQAIFSPYSRFCTYTLSQGGCDLDSSPRGHY